MLQYPQASHFSSACAGGYRDVLTIGSA